MFGGSSSQGSKLPIFVSERDPIMIFRCGCPGSRFFQSRLLQEIRMLTDCGADIPKEKLFVSIVASRYNISLEMAGINTRYLAASSHISTIPHQS